MKRIVLGGCGHWWSESGPDITPTTPRVCMATHTSGGVVGHTDQGYDLVSADYVPDGATVTTVVERWPQGSRPLT